MVIVIILININDCVPFRWHIGKEFTCQAGDSRDTGSIPGLGRSSGVGNNNPLSILAWTIPWIEEPGGLQFTEMQTVGHD